MLAASRNQFCSSETSRDQLPLRIMPLRNHNWFHTAAKQYLRSTQKYRNNYGYSPDDGHITYVMTISFTSIRAMEPIHTTRLQRRRGAWEGEKSSCSRMTQVLQLFSLVHAADPAPTRPVLEVSHRSPSPLALFWKAPQKVKLYVRLTVQLDSTASSDALQVLPPAQPALRIVRITAKRIAAIREVSQGTGLGVPKQVNGNSS